MSINNVGNMPKYKECLKKRQEKYGRPLCIFDTNIHDNLTNRGYDIFDGDLSLIETLRNEANEVLKDKKVTEVRADGRYKIIKKPLVNCPSTVPLIFHTKIMEIATDFFDCVPAIGTCNLRRSYVTGLPPATTQLWHTDRNCPVFLKFFIYLNDVGEKDGPFTYIEGSYNDKPDVVDQVHRWNDKQVLGIWPKERQVKLTADFGKVITCNTRGMHKGSVPKVRERTMFTMNFVVHPENWDNGTRFAMRQEDFDKLDDNKKPLADFLIKV